MEGTHGREGFGHVGEHLDRVHQHVVAMVDQCAQHAPIDPALAGGDRRLHRREGERFHPIPRDRQVAEFRGVQGGARIDALWHIWGDQFDEQIFGLVEELLATPEGVVSIEADHVVPSGEATGRGHHLWIALR